MAPAPFAAAESRINRAIFQTLSNAVVVINYGEPFHALFEDDYHVASVGIGMGSTIPTVLAPAAHVPHDCIGMQILVNDLPYAIAAVQRDSTGSVRLMLEAA